MLDTIFIVIGICKADRVESAFTLRVSQAIDQGVCLRPAKREMPQRIHHTTVLVMEKLQHRTIPFSDLDLIVQLFLHSVHRRCVLIKIASNDDQVSLLVIRRILERLSVHKLLQFFDLLVTADEGLHEEWQALFLITGLEVGVE